MHALGHISDIVRYPVKSMAGVATDSAALGWHGLAGDRRFAVRRLGDESGFPWLTASRLADLLRYQPTGVDEQSGEPLPTHVRTPDGALLGLRSPELRREIAERLGADVELMHMKHGVFDDAAISVISLATITGIGRDLGVDLDRRRFRANVVLDVQDAAPFHDDGWVGGTLVFGASEPRAMVRVTARDVRCMMINLDPDTAVQDARILKSVVRLNANHAGVYGTVVQAGTIHVGQPVSLISDAR
jgi:uncharacterized protein YcbX